MHVNREKNHMNFESEDGSAVVVGLAGWARIVIWLSNADNVALNSLRNALPFMLSGANPRSTDPTVGSYRKNYRILSDPMGIRRKLSDPIGSYGVFEIFEGGCSSWPKLWILDGNGLAVVAWVVVKACSRVKNQKKKLNNKSIYLFYLLNLCLRSTLNLVKVSFHKLID